MSKIFKLFFVFFLIINHPTSHAFFGSGESEAKNEESAKVSSKSTARVGASDQIPGVDGDLVSAIRSGNVLALEEALVAGANPNIELCPLPPVNYRSRYGLVGQSECDKRGASVRILDLILRLKYPVQLPLIGMVAKHGGKWDKTGSSVIAELSGVTVNYDRDRPEMGYVQEKVAVAKALYDTGMVFSDEDIYKWAVQWPLSAKESNAVVREIAASIGKLNIYEARLREFQTAQGNSVTLERGKSNLREVQLAQEKSANLERDKSNRQLKMVRVVGQKICKIIDGTERHLVGRMMGQVVYGASVSQTFYITGFTEQVAGEKIQLRIAGIRKIEGDRMVNVDKIDGDTVLQTNNVIWDDPILWRPCDS